MVTSKIENVDTSSSNEKFSSDTESGESSFVKQWKNIKDSFKRQEQVNEVDMDIDIEKGEGQLKRSLQNRHLQMIAIGGSVGTGLMIGSGSSLRTGGPAALLIGWGIVGTMVFATIHALGELCIEYPVNGAFSSYSTRFVDPSWGFAVGWNYGIMWLIVLPIELVAAAMSIKYWNSSINPVAWVAIFYIFILVINLFGVRIYGEAEFCLAIFKVMAIVGFIILGVVLVCGGGPTHEFVGNKYWENPGAFANGFKGVATVFVTASYSLAGSEMVGLAAAETENPRKVLPKAVKQVFWRIFLFYFLSLTFIGLLVPYNSPDLLGDSGTSTSPFVIAIKNGGIKILPSIFNAIILISVISTGNSAVYGCSRTIQSLGLQGLGPSFLAYVDRKGRPLGGLCCSAVFGLLCFLSAYSNESTVFNWLLSVSGLASIFSWFSICLCHVRFRMALRKQGRSTKELSFTSAVGVWGSIYSMVILVLVLIGQFWVALFPLGSSPSASTFFQNYLGVVVIFVFYVGHKIYSRNWKFCKTLNDIDLDSGKRTSNMELLQFEIEEEKKYFENLPIYKKVFNFWC